MANKMTGKNLTCGLLTFALSGAQAQLMYGENQRGTIKDSDIVASAFPEIEGFELLSPAFLRNETLPPGWSNGTDGPTDDTEMGMAVHHLQRQ